MRQTYRLANHTPKGRVGLSKLCRVSVALQFPETPVISRTNDQRRRYAALDTIRRLQEQRRDKRVSLHRIARQYNIAQLARVDFLTLQHTSGLMEARRCAHCRALMWVGECIGGSLKALNFGLCSLWENSSPACTRPTA